MKTVKSQPPQSQGSGYTFPGRHPSTQIISVNFRSLPPPYGGTRGEDADPWHGTIKHDISPRKQERPHSLEGRQPTAGPGNFKEVFLQDHMLTHTGLVAKKLADLVFHPSTQLAARAQKAATKKVLPMSIMPRATQVQGNHRAALRP